MAAEEKCFTKDSLPTTNVKVRQSARLLAHLHACIGWLSRFCLTAHLPAYLQVSCQHNHVDCGLYMLRYIELLSQHRTPSCAQWKAAPTKRQSDYNELKFSAASIDEKRGAMCREIRALGKKTGSK